jgi:methylthioribose-1-phosphate isomerase
MIDPVRFDGDAVILLDQRALPGRVEHVVCRSADEVVAAIQAMVVRGAPAIGIAAAYGLAVEAARGTRGAELAAARDRLAGSRPTAVNLRAALDRLVGVPVAALAAEARAIHDEDRALCAAMGAAGAALLPPGAVVYTHCNTGALATGGIGTALGVIRAAEHRDRASGRGVHVFAGETRPWLQGARLTAWELAQEGIEVTLVVDGAAASVLPRCDAVLVGADRIAANGDTANKIGTHGLAILAAHHGVPFYVVAPSTSIDPACPNGRHIPVEERDGAEVLGHGGARWAAEVPVFNPAFDVTPAALVTAFVTERGVEHPPFVR